MRFPIAIGAMQILAACGWSGVVSIWLHRPGGWDERLDVVPAGPPAPLTACRAGFGCLFDALSLLYYALTFSKRRFHSGFPMVGFAFYFWVWLAYPQPVLLAGGEGFWRIALAKLPDLLAPGAVHALVQLSPTLLLCVTKRKIRHGYAPDMPAVPPCP
jgi:hypothetical protein